MLLYKEEGEEEEREGEREYVDAVQSAHRS